jgi:hypothetical protein
VVLAVSHYLDVLMLIRGSPEQVINVAQIDKFPKENSFSMTTSPASCKKGNNKAQSN